MPELQLVLLSQIQAALIAKAQHDLAPKPVRFEFEAAWGCPSR